MKKFGIVLAGLVALSQLMIAAPKETKVKYGKNIYFSGEVDKNIPAGAGALYLKVNKDSTPEVINGIFRDNIIDDGTVRMTLANGDVAIMEGRFIFVAPLDKEATTFELIFERGTIKVGGETYTVPTNVSFLVAPDEFLGISYRTNDTFYTTMRKKGSNAVAYGLVRSSGSDFGAQIAKVDSLRVGGDMYYPLADGLWRNWLNKTDYIDARKNDDNTFSPVAIHRVNPFDGGVVDSDSPGSIYDDQLYTGTIKYPDNSKFEGTFHYQITVDVRYVDGTFTGNDVVDTWKEGLNLTEIERARLRKIERIRQEIATMVAQADTTADTFVGRRYINIKEADQSEYGGKQAWILTLDYIDFTTKTKGGITLNQKLIYAVDPDTQSLGEVLFAKDVPLGSGDAFNYIENHGKIYLWLGDVPMNYDAFFEILSGYDIALRSEKPGNTRYFRDDPANDTLTKEICKKLGVPYITKAEADLAVAESLNL
ncbi:MAG: hypothetical protein J5675_04930 [Bacteroidales bacterium]|nr:hypothetical protein [Bacteroidales bacterium]